ncbi:anti-sigma factor [Cedecea davisae]|uniref:Anti-sigma factor n=1 Tax=Cedecea davisae TaxID=158484 RepID=A0ABS6DH29_9ENTR|nr:anti-sigma factor [Cedecea davisae]MBU4682413.1 anti-sigma factor [Cedecea davisae]MBU4685456.1 anti-sigma factor [Cedecea davisae]
MNSSQKRDNALAAEYALGTLRGNARLRFEKRLRLEPELAAVTGRWQMLLAGLDSHIAPQQPPESVWKKIQLSLPPERSNARSRWSWNYLGWALAAGIAAVALVPYFGSKVPELAPLMVLNGATQQGQWLVSADSERKTLSLTPLRTAAISASNSLQLWAIPVGAKPVSLGLLDSRAQSKVSNGGVTLSRGVTIAISLEPQGGSPTGQPTGPVVYSGVL